MPPTDHRRLPRDPRPDAIFRPRLSSPTRKCAASGSARLARYIRETREPTPFLVVDGQVVTSRLARLRTTFPGAELLYAVKANPLPQVLALVAAAGAGGDVASAAEIRQCLAAGLPAERLSFGNTIKHRDDVAYAWTVGVRRFAVDSLGELEKVARHAPGASVLVRLLVETSGAQWPLSRKFGCDVEMAVDLLRAAPGLGLRPYGVSFHVGSQQTDPTQWDGPLAMCAAIDGRLRRVGQSLEAINLGGGFPAQYAYPVPSLEAYARAIALSLRRHFGDRVPHLIIEPGRALVAEAGVLVTSVLLVARKSRADAHQWAFLDCGKFGGLPETADEAIRYPIVGPRRQPEDVPTILAGPTCDSADILYERVPYRLAADLREGDRLQILSAGAYTYTYASVGFNGFSPLRTVFL